MNIVQHQRSVGERLLFPTLLVPAAAFAYTWFGSDDTFPIRAFPFIVLSMIVIGQALDTISPKVSKWKGIVEAVWAIVAISSFSLSRSVLFSMNDDQSGNIAILALTGFSLVSAILLFWLNGKASYLDTESERVEDKELANNFVSSSLILTLLVASVLVGPGILWMTVTISTSLLIASSPMIGSAVLICVLGVVVSVVRVVSPASRLTEGLAPKGHAARDEDPEPDLPENDVDVNGEKEKGSGKHADGRFGYDKNGLKKDASGHTYGRKEGDNG